MARKRVRLDEAAVALFRQWGREGGRKRAKAISKERQREIGRKAGRARWAKLTVEQRRKIGKRAALARWSGKR